jgi:uncharacterized membrane protein
MIYKLKMCHKRDNDSPSHRRDNDRLNSICNSNSEMFLEMLEDEQEEHHNTHAHLSDVWLLLN